jgi:hypothetical protein
VRVRLSRAVIAPLALTAVLAGAGASTARPASAEPRPDAHAPTPSLEPARTAAAWRSLVRREPLDLETQTACRPLRAVFYAASDWLRLATKLASAASPCAEYYVSVPPLVADKTTFRRDQAWRIRALGRNFHAMAEIHFATWTRWVQSTGNSWHSAGVTARERMAEAGYDVALGDTWALNELTSAVRRGDGNARTNISEFLRGLYEGNGSRPTRGAALVIGFGQRTSDVSAYQNTLQGWLSDTAFWTDMSAYVSDWSQEVYGDIRAHAVPGVPVAARREYLNDYLQHKLVLAGAGPTELEPARSYLREAYSPLANGAWPRETAWGWTMVPFEQMGAYVAAQVDAMRAFSITAGQSRDHFGFAWAPRNTTGLSNADFATQTGQILDRMASSIRDSSGAAPESATTGACGGDESLCAIDLEGAVHNGAWRSFRAWAQSTLSFGPAAPTRIVAGVPSPPLELAVAAAVARPVPVTIRSSSPAGAFSTGSAGPWTSSLTLPVTPGSVTSVFYRDTRAGVATLTATSPGTTQATREVTVVAGVAARVALTPAARTVRARGETTFTGAATDAFGNVAPGTLAWSVSPSTLGTLSKGAGNTVTFRAGRTLGGGTVTAALGSTTGSATVTVQPEALRVTAAFKRTARGVLVTLAAVDPRSRPVSRATVVFAVRLDGRRVARARAETGAAGKTRLAVPAGRGCYTVILTRASAQGFIWNARPPRARLCTS